MASANVALHRLVALVSPYVRDALSANRERAHNHVMSAFQRATSDVSPRSELGVLWYLDAQKALLTVQSTVPPLHPGLLGDIRSVAEVSPPPTGAGVRVRLFCNVQKCPPSCVSRTLHKTVKARSGRAFRSRLVIVPETDRQSWALRRLARAGLVADPATVTVGRVGAARLARCGQAIPAAELTARATVYDAAQLSDALVHGVGKGKNYGLGLLRLDHFDR